VARQSKQDGTIGFKLNNMEAAHTGRLTKAASRLVCSFCKMKKADEVKKLAQEILEDFDNDRHPLPNILRKASRLSEILKIPFNVTLFKDWAKDAEHKEFIIGSFQSNIESAKDAPVSIQSANPNQYVMHGNNNFERNIIRNEAKTAQSAIAGYRTETYNFVSGIYNSEVFGNLVESIFERKRSKTEPKLISVLPDGRERICSIEDNLKSQNPEDWKNAVVSCRALLMDIADAINPATNEEDKNKYINRLKDYISPKIESKTKKKLSKTFLDELNKRIEQTLDLIQGPAHKDRPTKEMAEDVVLYTYLVISEILAV
jgi:hypothetical protein